MTSFVRQKFLRPSVALTVALFVNLGLFGSSQE